MKPGFSKLRLVEKNGAGQDSTLSNYDGNSGSTTSSLNTVTVDGGVASGGGGVGQNLTNGSTDTLIFGGAGSEEAVSAGGFTSPQSGTFGIYVEAFGLGAGGYISLGGGGGDVHTSSPASDEDEDF